MTEDEKDERRHLSAMNEQADVLWKMLEENYIAEIVAIKEEAEVLSAAIKRGDDVAPTAREAAVVIMASLAHGEILRRKLERIKMDAFMHKKMKE